METLNVVPHTFNMREPIAGYVLRERIGVGGYGEVWRADAPGGLEKAIKIVFGPLDDGRSERELEALNRIKQVRHPLLLSLERIEMVDEHLIIVMELAQGSLQERFEESVAQGNRGIPRGDLLAYLRDVADALDYLYEEHSLQHLDVKPENLLLLANRVKVADFGLVKNLDDQHDSLVSGLTPLYAPPEVFDGRPSRNSDQYSLALVYQQLLTGEPAFAGRTAAQLAAQHLHSSPALAPLPTTDQPIIARALSKDPNRRFSSCRELIDAIADAPKSASRIRLPVPEQTRITQPLAVSQIPREASNKVSPQLAYPDSNEVTHLPPFGSPNERPTTTRPALFIGLGGTGAAVLRALRSRLCAKFGDIDDVPSLRMLLFDSDAAAITKATQGDRTTALRSNYIVPIRLRPSQAYRDDSDALLEWLSRRWLFNIPRSLATEGIRPLGRLAFVDHFETIANAIHHVLSGVVSATSLARSSDVTGLDFVDESPRIFVVSSTAGGLGSGSVLELGYLIRTMLEELHISDDGLCGLLSHSTSHRTNQRDLARANSLCLINELRQYTSAGGYPGEPACKLPPRANDSDPFRHTYITHLGNDLSDEGFLAATAKIGEYLFQNSVGSAAPFFDHCRDEATVTNNKTTVVRGFGIEQICRANDDAKLAATPELLNCGGSVRHLLVTPGDTSQWPAGWQQPFDQAAGAPVTVRASSDNALIVCCESQDTSLKNVASHFVGTRNDLAAAASRLHTRIDVKWPSLERWISRDE